MKKKMSDLVRVRHNGRDSNMSRFFAKKLGAEVLENEPTHKDDGTLRESTSSSSGRRAKPKTTVGKASAEKKAATKSASTEKENAS